MSDTQGTSPDPQPVDETTGGAQTPATPTPVPPASVPPVPAMPTPSASAPAATPQSPQTPASPPAPPQAVPTTAVPPLAAQPTAPTAPVPPAYAAAPSYAPQQTAPAYGGQAFGVPPATAAAPTTGVTTTTAPRKSSGAAKVAGLIVAAALVGGAAGLGGAYAGTMLWSDGTTTPAAGPNTVTVNDTDSVNATTAIAAKVVPSVVTISASSGDAGGTGSGVVLSEDGYVVTNTHVVTLDGQTATPDLRVTTADGRVFDAEVVGLDPTYDLAVIKLVDAEGLTPIEFASSSDLNVGDQTVAVGAPLGLSNSVTTGIVSALNRSIEIASSAAPDTGSDTEDQAPEEGQEGEQGQQGPFFFDFGQGETPQQTAETIKIAVIQTDAAINPGNSGGALVDGEGKLIGINVAIASAGSSSGQSGNIGVGFAIPSDVVQRVTDELISDGVATHGLLGANVQSAQYVEGTTITGAYIAEVVEGGAADEGGLEAGDIVTEFNGVPVTDATDITAQVRAAAAGSTATVTYVRDGESHTIEVTLGSLTE